MNEGKKMMRERRKSGRPPWKEGACKFELAETT
jgi:hypothetical protein